LTDHFDMMNVFEINGMDLAAETDAYAAIREMYGLSTHLAIRAIARAYTALRIPANMHSARDPTSNDDDARILPVHEWNWTFGQTLLSGRAKIATPLGDRQRAALKSRKPTSAVAVKRRDGGYFLHDLTDEPIDPGGVIGIDLGVKDLAVTDEGETFSGDGVEACRRKCHRIRKSCQAKGTKPAERKLRKEQMKENRYKAGVCRVISKRIIEKAKGTGDAIAVGDLTGIGDRTTARKSDRSRMKGWACFGQPRGS
jgi:putative transposase